MKALEKTAYIQTDVCIRRRLDAKKISVYLEKNNYRIVDRPDEAKLIIFVTCAFTNERTQYSLEKTEEFQKYNAELIVAGCLPGIDQNELSKIFKGKTLTPKTLDDIDGCFPGHNIKFCDIKDQNIIWNMTDNDKLFSLIEKSINRINFIKRGCAIAYSMLIKKLYGEYSEIYRFHNIERYFIRVSWGCLGNCSYCGIKKSIGSLKSKPINQCVEEFKNGIESGYKYFEIDADDAGAYGLDIHSNITELLENLLKIPGDFNISIRDFHPKWVVKYQNELEMLIKDRRLNHFYIPIQSGNERILMLMNRFLAKEKMKEIFRNLKQNNRELILSSHVIVGFPSETYSEFKESLAFINETGIDEGYLFKFSLKNGTEAESIEPKIAELEIINRMSDAKKILKDYGYHVYYQKKQFMGPPHFAFSKVKID